MFLQLTNTCGVDPSECNFHDTRLDCPFIVCPPIMCTPVKVSQVDYTTAVKRDLLSRLCRYLTADKTSAGCTHNLYSVRTQDHRTALFPSLLALAPEQLDHGDMVWFAKASFNPASFNPVVGRLVGWSVGRSRLHARNDEVDSDADADSLFLDYPLLPRASASVPRLVEPLCSRSMPISEHQLNCLGGTLSRPGYASIYLHLQRHRNCQSCKP